jgi:hypothetical protein
MEVNMEERIIIEFDISELKDLIINYYGLEDESFDINDYDNDEIKRIILDSLVY